MEKTVHKKNIGNARLRSALTRALAALLIALVLLSLSGFSFVDLLRGAKKVSTVGENDLGDYVSAEVNCILGYYAEDASASGSVKGRYAVVKLGDMLVTVHLSARYLESADVIFGETDAFYSGSLSALTHYFVVNGTVRELGSDAQALFYDWFGEHQGELVSCGAIDSVSDYVEILSDCSIEVDSVGSLSSGAAIALSIIAWVCLFYMAIVLIMAAWGRYDDKTEVKAEADEADEAEDDAEAVETPDEAAEDDAESGEAEDDADA